MGAFFALLNILDALSTNWFPLSIFFITNSVQFLGPRNGQAHKTMLRQLSFTRSIEGWVKILLQIARDQLKCRTMIFRSVNKKTKV
ncbi:hypothetical protein AM499_12940 [Bacillus sp. FJAT-22090]|nr:hypothetical protein AM499_12940 [Bacillus sp. FJAT-22090]